MRHYLDGASLATLAHDALNELSEDVARLAGICTPSFLVNIGISLGLAEQSVFDQCQTNVAAGRDLVSVRGPRLVARIQAGDADAAVSLQNAIANVRRSIESDFELTSQNGTGGGLFRRFTDEVIAQTGKDLVASAKTLAVPGVASFGLALGVVLGIWLILETRR